jgi:tripartite-type tricarboxylate transporter receptor subunit TctC
MPAEDLMIVDRRQFVFFAGRITAAAALFSAFGAKADDWPRKPVRIIVPYAAGGSADVWARIIADPLGVALGQPFYVENRGGAGGLIGSQAVVNAEPDGYTLLLSGIGSQVISPVINKSASVDSMRDYTHIAYLGGPPFVFVVHPSLGLKNFKELVSLLKSRKEEVGYVSPGLGTFGNLLAELLGKIEQVKLDHIPYKGAAPAMVDLVGGHVKIGCVTLTSAAPHIRAGSVVPLAMSSPERLTDFPDVPTLKELGYLDLVATTWFALSGPSGLPNDIVERLNREVIRTLDAPGARRQMQQEDFLTQPMTPRQFTDFMRGEIAKWGPIAEQVIKS